jgi:restriction endonuclease Mrr
VRSRSTIAQSRLIQPKYALGQDPAYKLLKGGHQLARLMIGYNIGVENRSTIVEKKLDSDYFEDGEE